MLPKIVGKDFKNQWLDISTEEYRKLEAANFSTLKHMLRSPAYYYAKLMRPAESTPAMKYGTTAHMALLEGEKFRSAYVVEPQFEGLTQDGKVTFSKNSKDVKNKLEEWRKSLPPYAVIITDEELKSLTGIIESLLSNPKLFAAIKHGIPELKGTWRDPITGIQCKMALDLWMPEQWFLLDFKTTSKSTVWEVFRKSVENLEYDFQMGMYGDGVEQITGQFPKVIAWVAIDVNDPYEIEIHLVHELYLANGRNKYKFCLKKLKECMKENKFPQRQHERDFEMPEPSSFYMKSYEGVMDYE